MEYAISTEGQGGVAYLTIPSVSINAGTTQGISGFEFDVIPLVASSAGFVNLFGTSSTNVTAFRIEAASGSLQWRYSSTVLLASPPGSVVMGVRQKLGAEWEEATASLWLTINQVRVAGPFVVSSQLQTSIAWNQIGKVGTSSPSPQAFTLYGLQVYGPGATYNDTWNGSTTTGTGTSWTSTSGTRSLTITGATGAADSWWIPQGATLVPVTSFSILETDFRAEVSSSVQATTSFRQSLEKLGTLETSLRANVSRSFLASASFRADVAGLYILETAFGASLSPVQRAAALQVVLRSQVSSSKTAEAALRNNVSKASQASAVFRANVSKASTVSTALRASLEAQTALQAQLLGIASAYKVLSVNLEGITDWTAPAFRVSMSLETPRASLSFGNKAGISFSTPRAKI